jgi:8-oxo-dGTP diphosphatase
MADATQSIVSVATPIAIAVVEHNNCFLIGQRPPGVVLAGFWEFPGGKVRDGEKPTACAIRECREESGMEVEVLRLLRECNFDYEHGRVHLRFFLCRPLDPAQRPRPRFQWVSWWDLNRYSFPPANEELLRLLQTQTQL